MQRSVANESEKRVGILETADSRWMETCGSIKDTHRSSNPESVGSSIGAKPQMSVLCGISLSSYSLSMKLSLWSLRKLTTSVACYIRQPSQLGVVGCEPTDTDTELMHQRSDYARQANVCVGDVVVGGQGWSVGTEWSG